MRHRSLLTLLGVACAGALAAAGAARGAGSQIAASYVGPSDPQASGWSLVPAGSPFEAFLLIHTTGIADDLGLPVWEIDDDTSEAGIQYQMPLTAALAAQGRMAGWTLRARVRIVPQSGPIDPASGPAGVLAEGFATSAPEVRFGSRSAADGGNLRVRAPGKPEIEIAGGPLHHLVELVYEPPPGVGSGGFVPGSYDVFVDGVERISDVPITVYDQPFGSVFFGSVQYNRLGVGQARYQQVELEVKLMDCGDSLDNDGDGLTDDADPGCEEPTDATELDGFACNDDADDDGDGLVDMADPGCAHPGDDIEFHFAPGAPAFAAEVSLRFEPGNGAPAVEIAGVGVAPVHVQDGRLAHVGIPALSGVAREPYLTPTLITAVELDAALPSNTLALTPSGPVNTLPVAGAFGYRDEPPPAAPFFALPLHSGESGALGAGGRWHYGNSSIVFTFTGAPWTLGAAVARAQIGTNPNVTIDVTRTGFAHGPLSNTSTVAQPSGVVQLVTPFQIKSIGVPGPNKIAAFGSLRLRFVPEPRAAALLASGALALIGLGRRRARAR